MAITTNSTTDTITFTPSSNPQFTTIELGHESDTTIERSSAGVVTIEVLWELSL